MTPPASWRSALLAPFLSLITAAAGCVPMGYLASGFDAQQVPARYSLADRPTLVLVDDPAGRFRIPGASAVAAGRIGFDLRERGVLAHVVDQQEVADLTTELGERYGRTPVDAVGRALGAEQVIYVYVDMVSLHQEPGMLRPQAQVYVKVIDAAASRRLFPSSEADTGALDRGYLVAAALPPRTQLADHRTQVPATLTDLADRTGAEVARLFYKHRRDQIPLDRPTPR